VEVRLHSQASGRATARQPSQMRTRLGWPAKSAETKSGWVFGTISATGSSVPADRRQGPFRGQSFRCPRCPSRPHRSDCPAL